MGSLHHRRAGLLPAVRSTALLLCLAVPSTRPFVLTPVVMSSTPREGRPFSTRQLKIGDRPAPFETISSSGPTVEAAIRSLREAVGHDAQASEGGSTGGGVANGGTTRTAMGLLFYTRCDEDDAPGGGHSHPLGDEGPGSSGVREELSQLHGRLPFVDHIIASPALATATSEHGYDDDAQGGTSEASERPPCSATLVLINNPDLKVTPFVLGEDFASSDLASTGRVSSLLREDDAIEDAVARALEQRASCNDGVAGGGSGGGGGAAAASAPVGQFGSICLAFGGGSNADGGNAECMSQLRRLNGILRRARPTFGINVVDGGISSGGIGSGGVGGGGHDCKRCPLVASATMTDGGDETIVSTWDDRRGAFRTAAGAVVGALISASPDSTATAFQLVHAGDHVPLRGSQFRIKRMQGGDIAEVMPVRPLTMDEHMRPRCGDGAMAAADWCRDAVVASTWFEKIAMQSALGVGVLRRVNHDSRTRNCHILSREAVRQEGVIPYLPADACIGIAEVETGGSLLLTPPCSGDTLAEHVHPSGFTWRGGAATAGAEAAATTVKGLRPGDLCDFRAIGSLATIQAEHDAYAWLHAARLSASILRPVGSNTDGGSGDSDSGTTTSPASTSSSGGVQGIQGCLSAGAASRFGIEFVQEGCDGVASAAAEHGGCPAVGIVPGLQVVSVDNEMVTCSTSACLASVYVCGQVGTY